MLSNVLPGLREIRAPLTAGYIWLISAWLVFHSSIPTEQEARGGPWEPFFDLGGVVSSFGLTVVLSVLAYLIGSLSEGIFREPMQAGARVFGGGPSWDLSWKGVKSLELLVQDRVSRVIDQLADKGLSLRQLPEYERASRLIEGGVEYLNKGSMFVGVQRSHVYPLDAPKSRWWPSHVYRALKSRRTRQFLERPRPTWIKHEEAGNDALSGASESGALPRVLVRLYDWNIREAASPLEKRRMDLVLRSKELDDSWSKSKLEIEELLAGLQPAKEARQSKKEEEKEARQSKKEDEEIPQQLLVHHVVREITNQVTQEMPLVGTRLLGKETDLFHEFDRQRGESNFRSTIIPPLLVLIIVLAIRVNFAFLLLLGSVPLFYWQGVRYRQEASDVLIDSLVVGRVEAPAIEKLERAAARRIAYQEGVGAQDQEVHGQGHRSSAALDPPPSPPVARPTA
jgi:hypothetical protein